MSFVSQLGARFRAELIGRIVAVGSGALLLILLSRVLGPDRYGLLFLALSIIGIAEIFAKFGIGKSAARYISEYKTDKPGQIRYILNASIIINIIIISIVSLIFLLLHEYIAEVLNEPGLEPLLFVGILYLVFSPLSVYSRHVLQGFEAIQESALIHGFARFSRLFIAGGLVLIGFSAIGALWGYVLSFALTAVLGMGIVFRKYYRKYKSASNIEEGLARRIGEYMLPLTATRTANILDKRIDVVLVGFFLNPIAVGYYVLSKQIIDFVRTPADALGFTISPTFASERADGNLQRASRLYETAILHSLMLYVPASAGLAIVGSSMIELVFGGEYLGAAPVLQILSMYLILQAITMVTGNTLDFLGRARTRAIYKAVTSTLNAGLNILLIPRIGVVGAALATVITYSMYTFSEVYIINQELDIRLLYITRRSSLIGIITVVMAVPVYFASIFIQGFVTLFATVLLGACIWAIVSVALGLLDIRQTLSAIIA